MVNLLLGLGIVVCNGMLIRVTLEQIYILVVCLCEEQIK
jgi:hypothetical protein